MKEKDNGDVTMEVFHANSTEKEGLDTPEVTVVNDLDEKVRMKPTIGLLNSITIIIGSMIGSGIFISPSGILANMNSFGASILIWIACGIYSLLGAYCYAELGTMLHSSGGDYAYVLEAFGPFVGFLRLWVEVIVARPVAIAIISMTFAQYILQPIYPDCEQPKEAKACLATMCVLLLSFINGMSVRMSTLVQDVFTLVKMAALLLIIVTGIVQIGRGRLRMNLFTFASRVYGPVWWIMPIFVACSTFGGVNGTIMTTSRIFFVASRENQMPRVCSFLQMDLLTPIPAVIITCIISIVYLLTGSINSLITYLGFVQWLAIGLCVFIVIVFRFTRPDAERPVRAPIAFAVIYVLGTIFLVIFAFVGSPTESGYGVAIIVVGIPFFFLTKYFDRLPKNVRTSMNNFTVSWQKLLKLVPGN
ncbi:putative cationic amino acid transporter [Fasciola gigantica]|uniref:Putative cationic amino acid transporter n=1 Tax=Fasciola gigantica TaxID=46835 RepID=A0A504YEK7_FASGI|nr:putative cationic amino acid transporter [Fasciola gigantica]